MAASGVTVSGATKIQTVTPAHIGGPEFKAIDIFGTDITSPVVWSRTRMAHGGPVTITTTN
jgi:hypothetical protein